MNILTLNAGSNSLKFEIVAADPAQAGSEENPAFGKSLLSDAYNTSVRRRGRLSYGGISG
jgi:acetate kinase